MIIFICLRFVSGNSFEEIAANTVRRNRILNILIVLLRFRGMNRDGWYDYCQGLRSGYRQLN